MQATSLINTPSSAVTHPLKQVTAPRFSGDSSYRFDASKRNSDSGYASDSPWGKLLSGVIAVGATVAILFQLAQLLSSFAKGFKAEFAKPVNPNDHLPSSDNLSMRNFRDVLFETHPDLIEQEMLPINTFYQFAKSTAQFQPDYLESEDAFLEKYNQVAKNSKQHLLVKETGHYAPYEGVMLMLDTLQRDEAIFLKNKTLPES